MKEKKLSEPEEKKELTQTLKTYILCRSEKERIRSVYNKTIIRFTFCDIQNNQVRIISLSLRLRLITPTSTLIILDITKTSSNKGRYVFYWGRWAGASEGRVLSKFFTHWGRSNLFYSQPGEGHSYFDKEKITPCRFYFVYTSKATSQD